MTTTMALLTILTLLFIALFVLVTLTEKFGKKGEQPPSQLGRFIVPLLIIMVALQVIRFVFFPDGF